MRAKWSAPIRKYWKISEQMMVKYCDLAICDSVNIEKYIHECYDGKGIKGRNPKTTFIAYGADLTLSKLSDDDEKLVNWYKEKELTKKDYYLVVGRFVPENSFEIMIREFMKSKSKKDFAIITNVNEKFLNELEEKLHFKSDKRIKFVGTVYDQELLKKIRENAYGRNINWERDRQDCALPQRTFPRKVTASVENQKLFFIRTSGQGEFHAVIPGMRNSCLEAERNEPLRRLDCAILFPQRLNQCIRIQKAAVFVLLDFGDRFRCVPIRNIEPTIQFKNVQLRLCVVGSFVHEAKRLTGTIERDGILCTLFQGKCDRFSFHNASSIVRGTGGM